MTLLDSLHPDSTAAVIGASGGIGRAFVELLAGDPGIRTVHAFSRAPLPWPLAKVHGHRLDLGDESSIEAACRAASQDAAFDIVLVASGILHRGAHVRPEKSMRDFDPASLAEVLAVNAIGPAIVAKHFLPKLRRGHKAVFAALSARVGSIGDNRLGGWAAYRMSKAALNMLVRTVAIEQARVSPASVVVALHPGTVDTGLSQPFTGRVKPGQLFTPEQAARRLLATIDTLQPADSGGFFAYDGTRIDY